MPGGAHAARRRRAVDSLLPDDERRRREGAAPGRPAYPHRVGGTGKDVGYESLIDGGPSPFTATTRERSLLLVLPHGPFEQLFNGEEAVSASSST